MKRLSIKAVSVLVSIMVIVTAFTACTTASTTNTASPTVAAADTSGATAATEPTAAAADPFGKYDPAITVNVCLGDVTAFKETDENKFDDNVWTRAFLDNLGIKLNYMWVVVGDSNKDKLTLAIASGDVPDIFSVDATQYEQLYSAGSIEDLTGLYEQYASPFLKDVMNRDDGVAIRATVRDGKQYALPNYSDPKEDVRFIWLRSDWLKNVGLQPPKTMDDLMNIARAFTKDDPDRNGKADTYGLAVNKDLLGWMIADLGGFFHGYHAYPDQWIKGSDGTIVNGSIQPEMKNALAKLQELYAEGIINKEFGVKNNDKVIEDIVGNKVGLEYGHYWAPMWPLNQTHDKDPNADWAVYPIVSADSQPALNGCPGLGIGGYYVVKKGFEHPEALYKMMSLSMEKVFNVNAQPEIYQQSTVDNNGIFHLNPIFMEPANKNTYAYLHCKEALGTKDTSILNPEEKKYYDQMTNFLNGDQQYWMYYRVFGGLCPFQISQEIYKPNNQYMSDIFTGSPTPTMVEKSDTLLTMEKEMITRIIMGAPVADFDKFVTNWKTSGGDQITAEVNEWYQKQPK
jgi:putative aldouronate transport system substrate-binding protein